MTDYMTLGESAQSLHDALADFIEASYHIGDQRLVEDRRQLLQRPGVIAQTPYLESTPRYVPGPSFEDLGLPGPAHEILAAASRLVRDGAALVHNPPYEHQADALDKVVVQGRSVIVTTGTGSGKTECFLFPILGHLAVQASARSAGMADPAVRALLLYPMNALVNDQLGRLRLLFGDPEIARWFTERWGRPARFARYTSRTLYPGVRSAQRDQTRLKPLRTYYVEKERNARGKSAAAIADAALIAELKRKGKWPAKSDLDLWFGQEGSRWQDSTGDFRRCVTLPDDAELLTRHEVLAAPPDLLVTNYSMLEYMLMRPLERSLFDNTRKWLQDHPTQKFIVVVDEAHLYRGSSGAEVALLLRRLRDRLGLSAERLQVICTTASFSDMSKAPGFAAALSGKLPADFDVITGHLDLRVGGDGGDELEANLLASIDLATFYGAEDVARIEQLAPLLTHFGIAETDPRFALFDALVDYPPMKLLINETMKSALPVTELSRKVFPGVDERVAERACAALVALGSFSRKRGFTDGAGLLPSRLHAFFRGLAGLWICIDPNCSGLPESSRGGVAGLLYGQPVERCVCGSRVFEYYTCRHCGSSYCRAYTDDTEDPSYLWSSPGTSMSSVAGSSLQMDPIDILLDHPLVTSGIRPIEIDLMTGRIDPRRLGSRVRIAHISDKPDDEGKRIREFKPCGVCSKQASYGRSSVQDHQTKGDEPFQALVSRQVEIQPPVAEPSTFAPLRGRKTLVFSDSRQQAAKLAPNLQRYTTLDAVRPLLAFGYQRLATDDDIRSFVSLEETYLAAVLAARQLGVRLRPATRLTDTFEKDIERVEEFLSLSAPSPMDKLKLLFDFRITSAPEPLVIAIHRVIHDPYTGFAPLGLATLEPLNATVIEALPDLAGVTTKGEKAAIVRHWLAAWQGAWLKTMPTIWAEDEIGTNSGRFQSRMKFILPKGTEKTFYRDWLPVLHSKLCDPVGAEFRLRGADVTLAFEGEWGYCQACRSTQRPVPGREELCAYCGQRKVKIVDPEADAVFQARKGYYRRSTRLALTTGQPPVALVAAEHTAQLNEAQADAVFSEAEQNELLFQDIDLGEGQPAIDVLSCTTTMEVGIDIGALAGVALRNMPPSRANYQQRSGRAGRRGKAVATVTAFANTQSHDEHAFAEPDEFIRGSVIDPEMNLDNHQIARRHLSAFVLQEYLQHRLPGNPGSVSAYGSQLFEVLGTVEGFRSGDSPLNRDDFRAWLRENDQTLADRAGQWLPAELGFTHDSLIQEITATAVIVDNAIGHEEPTMGTPPSNNQAKDYEEVPAEVGDAVPGSTVEPETLLGRLLYKAVLPRYAFPTDVATFHVFDSQASKTYRPVFQYTPSQGMAAALSQYAPGKRIWIGGREWFSGAVYSRVPDERHEAWVRRQLYVECGTCHYATTTTLDVGNRTSAEDCPACGAPGALGPAQVWIRPPGFAHPSYMQENTSPDDDVEPSYATRAKLTAVTPAAIELWSPISERIALHPGRFELLVTNRGPSDKGYSYCTICGLIEPATTLKPSIVPGHKKPYPDEKAPVCRGDRTAAGIVLGTSFISDVLLVGLKVEDPLTIRPEYESTRSVLRTVAEAFAIQASRSLSIGVGELQAEFRPALTPGGRSGTEAEIYIYDTLPGGAGYSRRIAALGREFFEATLKLLEECPAGCDASCYRCLRSFNNKFDHVLLDRFLGAGLLRYLLNGADPTMPMVRVESTTDLLFSDLESLGVEDLTLQRNVSVAVPGFGTLTAPILARRQERNPVVVGLHHPLAPTVMLNRDWTEPAEYGVSPVVVRVDELLTTRNLPRASEQVLSALGY